MRIRLHYISAKVDILSANPLTTERDSTILPSNARSVGAPDVPQWVREYPVPHELHEYLLKRRQALLMEVADIERILNLPPRRVMRATDI